MPRSVSYTKSDDLSFSVRATKKGGVPITLGKRPKGHVCTIVSNVTGAAALLKKLKPMLGAGSFVFQKQ